MVALDLAATGVELGQAYRERRPGRAGRVRFAQADLRRPPLGPVGVDAAGVPHHTPDTAAAF